MPWWLTLALLTSSVWDAPLPELQNPTAEEGHAVLLLNSSGKSSCTSEAIFVFSCCISTGCGHLFSVSLPEEPEYLTSMRFPGDGLCHLSSVTAGSRFLPTLSPFPHLPAALLWWMALAESCILVFRNVDSSAHVYWGAAFTTFASVHFSQGVHGAVDHDASVLAKTEIVVSLPVISGWTLCPRGAETLHPPQIWS